MLLSHAAKSSKIPRNEQYIAGGVCIVAFAAENTCATESNEMPRGISKFHVMG